MKSVTFKEKDCNMVQVTLAALGRKFSVWKDMFPTAVPGNTAPDRGIFTALRMWPSVGSSMNNPKGSPVS